MKSLIVPGSLITEKTAGGYLLRIARRLQQDMTMESSVVLYEIEKKIVEAGLLSWPEVEDIEIKAIQGAAV